MRRFADTITLVIDSAQLPIGSIPNLKGRSHRRRRGGQVGCWQVMVGLTTFKEPSGLWANRYGDKIDGTFPAAGSVPRVRCCGANRVAPNTRARTHTLPHQDLSPWRISGMNPRMIPGMPHWAGSPGRDFSPRVT